MTTHQRLRLYIFSIITGIIGAHASLVIFVGLTELQTFLYSANPLVWHELPWWRFVVPTCAAGLICAVISYWLAPTRKPEGIPQVIKAVHETNTPPPLVSCLVSAIQSVVTLGAGGSAGREGPAVHFASASVAVVTKFFRLEPAFIPYLVGSASAAAVAASFDAPFAAMLFSLEVVSRRISLKNAAPIVVAAAIGTLFNHLYEIEVGILHMSESVHPNVHEYFYFSGLAVLCALLSGIMIRMIFFVDTTYNRLGIPPFARPLIGGFCVGLIIWQFPWVMGVGIELARATLDMQFTPLQLVVLIIAKIVAVALTLGSRFAGGVFSPALVLGCMAGSAFGGVAITMGAGASDVSLYTIAAMGAVAAATLGAPLSTILMTFEITRNVNAVVPVMITVVICTILARHWTGWSFFDLVLWRERKVTSRSRGSATDTN